MALSQRLDLKLGQSLVMTPQLQQAIKLLQMSNIELQAFVEQELERNPLLERDERVEIQKQHTEESPAAAMDVALKTEESQIERMATLDTDLENVYTHESRADASNREAVGTPDSSWSSLRTSGGGSFDSEGMDFDAALTRTETLAEVRHRYQHDAV